MANQEPVQPNKIHFHLTGFQTGHGKVAFGTSLASEIYAEMRNIMQSFQKSMKGGVEIAKKLKLVDEKVQELMTEVQALGTVPMKPSQVVAWMSKFNETNAATKVAIEALGNPQWISMLDSSLSKVTKLVKSTNFLQAIQNAVKQLAYMEQVCKNISDNPGYGTGPNAATFFQAYKAFSADVGAIKTLGEHLTSLGNAFHDPFFVKIGKALGELQKSLQSIVDNIGGGNTGDGSFNSWYSQWVKDTQNDDTKGVKQTLAFMQSWWNVQTTDSWLWFRRLGQKMALDTAQATAILKTPLPPNFIVKIINAIETRSVKGITWLDFPVLDNQYKQAISGIQGMDQIGTQFSKASITTLNSLMTGMAAMIKSFNKAMMQSQRSVDLSITDINKRK